LRTYQIKFFIFISCIFYSNFLIGDDSSLFSDFEIRVIRPKFFLKKKKFEIGIRGSTITNETFINTYLMSGFLGYHMTDEWQLEGIGSYGLSIDKKDKKNLDKNFDIQTSILRIKYDILAGFIWTPLYGKFQLRKYNIIYFDTFTGIYSGLKGVEYIFDYCPKNDSTQKTKTYFYPNVSISFGQRFFFNEKSSFRWDFRNDLFFYDVSHGSCSKSNRVAQSSDYYQMVFELGYSLFL
jgi:outer membrane beta-barrel protein